MKPETTSAPPKVRVAILEDHQSTIDGYLYRLGRMPQIEVVGAAYSGTEMEALLDHCPVDVLFLDIQVPTGPDNLNPYPILHVIPKLLQSYPELAVLVISMLTERTLIQAVMDAGASGYILKDDRAAIEQLGAIVLSITGGGIYLSQQANLQLQQSHAKKTGVVLTARQLEAMSLCAAHPDWSRSQLAQNMGVSISTARNLLSNAYLRLGVPNLTAAIAKARQLGLVTPLPPTAPQ